MHTETGRSQMRWRTRRADSLSLLLLHPHLLQSRLDHQRLSALFLLLLLPHLLQSRLLHHQRFSVWALTGRSHRGRVWRKVVS